MRVGWFLCYTPIIIITIAIFCKINYLFIVELICMLGEYMIVFFDDDVM